MEMVKLVNPHILTVLIGTPIVLFTQSHAALLLLPCLVVSEY